MIRVKQYRFTRQEYRINVFVRKQIDELFKRLSSNEGEIMPKTKIFIVVKEDYNSDKNKPQEGK